MKEISKIYKILSVFIGIMSISCIAAFIMLCINGVRSDILIVTQRTSDVKADLSPAELTETYDYGDFYLNNMIIIADKQVSGLLESEELSEMTNTWTSSDGHLPLDFNINTTAIIHSDDSQRLSIPDALAIYKPQYILISIGLENGVEHCSRDKFREYYIKLIDSVKLSSPDSKIILQSILPVSKNAQKAYPNIANDKIDQANEWIAEIAQSCRINFLNTAPVLKDSKGNLDSRYDSGDGILINEDGLKVMLEYIKTHGYK